MVGAGYPIAAAGGHPDRPWNETPALVERLSEATGRAGGGLALQLLTRRSGLLDAAVILRGMSLEDFRLMTDRHYWGRDKILDALGRATQAQVERVQVPGLVPATELARHLMSFETSWFGTFAEGRPRDVGEPGTIAELKHTWAEVEGMVRGYLDGLAEEDLDRPMRITDDDGRVYRPLLRWVLTQLEAHSGQHQAELALIATVLGHSPGELGLWSYLEETSGGAPKE